VMEKFAFGQGLFVAEPKDSCIDFTYHNIYSQGPWETVWEFEGHTLAHKLEIGKFPDIFSVTPAIGWEVVTENFLKVAEDAFGIITVCQMGMM
jgi:hypothetical protein